MKANEIFKALETVAAATGEPQEIKFTIEGNDLQFSFVVENYGMGHVLSSVRCNLYQSMNVDKITEKFIYLYDYTIMGSRVNDKIEVSKIQLKK